MDDLISRQAAIDEMEEYWRSLNLRRKRIPLAAEAVYMDLKGVVVTLPSAQPEQRWIPCSERLPEKYGNYLVTTNDGEVDIGSCDPENKDRQAHFWSGCDADGFFWYGENIVIAWMPLPEPYQEEGEKDGKDT